MVIIDDTACMSWWMYVPHSEVARYVSEGWEPTPGLKDAHHGTYAVLMRWSRTGEPPCKIDSSTKDTKTRIAEAG